MTTDTNELEIIDKFGLIGLFALESKAITLDQMTRNPERLIDWFMQYGCAYGWNNWLIKYDLRYKVRVREAIEKLRLAVINNIENKDNYIEVINTAVVRFESSLGIAEK